MRPVLYKARTFSHKFKSTMGTVQHVLLTKQEEKVEVHIEERDHHREPNPIKERDHGEPDQIKDRDHHREPKQIKERDHHREPNHIEDGPRGSPGHSIIIIDSGDEVPELNNNHNHHRLYNPHRHNNHHRH